MSANLFFIGAALVLKNPRFPAFQHLQECPLEESLDLDIGTMTQHLEHEIHANPGPPTASVLSGVCLGLKPRSCERGAAAPPPL